MFGRMQPLHSIDERVLVLIIQTHHQKSSAFRKMQPLPFQIDEKAYGATVKK